MKNIIRRILKENEFDWSEEIVNSFEIPKKVNLGFVMVNKLIEVGDIITLTGDVNGNDNNIDNFEKRIYCTLNNNRFEVVEIDFADDGELNLVLKWLTPKDERPSGWKSICDNRDNFLIDEYSFDDDKNLMVTKIEKP
jgi:hypothetical protein